MLKQGDNMRKFLKCFLITVVLWWMVRFLPAGIAVFIPTGIVLPLLVSLFSLSVGWLAANAISRGRHPLCIRVNLTIFATLEFSSLPGILSKILELSRSTGRYQYDIYGVPYSEYPARIAISLCYMAAYIGLCALFWKLSATRRIQKRKNVPDNIPELRNVWYEDGCLFAEFKAGNITKYLHVPEKMYTALCAAPKKSQYLFSYIVGNFDTECVKKPDPIHRSAPSESNP